MKSLSKVFLARMAVLFAGMFFLVGAVPALADDATAAKNLVEKAKMSFNSFQSAKEMNGFRDLIKKAKGVFISPSVLKGAFIVGASGGSGVFLARDKKTNKWFGPAFYTMGEASFGLQIGGSASEVVLLAMTDRGVTAFLSNNFKLGADGSIAVGPVGVGAAAATANLSADIISFSRSKGLFGGVSVDGAVVGVRGSLNDAYYGKKVSPTDILVKHDVANKGAAGLITAVNKASAAKQRFIIPGFRGHNTGTFPRYRCWGGDGALQGEFAKPSQLYNLGKIPGTQYLIFSDINASAGQFPCFFMYAGSSRITQPRCFFGKKLLLKREMGDDCYSSNISGFRLAILEVLFNER